MTIQFSKWLKGRQAISDQEAALLGTAVGFLASCSRADHVFVPVVASSGQELARLDIGESITLHQTKK